MAPKRGATTTNKKLQSPMRQRTLSFKSTKRGPVASIKDQVKAKHKPKVLVKPEVSSEDEDERRDVRVSKNEVASRKLETLDLQDKSGKYKRYYMEAKAKMGWIPPIHSEGQTKVHEMLRVFDNTSEYGPCLGMTRLERWERAHELGLNPPLEIRDILLTDQGTKDSELVQPVFYGQVL